MDAQTDITEKRRTAYFGFYRKWHPDQFSDSTVVYDLPLTVELFDSQMDLLSTKKKQAEFENFSVGLMTKLVTPNIKPQTGPDGGGDGKVDAETFKVSDDIADKWYVEGEGARGDEKWAFAFSCKKEWKPKVISDVKKIVETGRQYSRIIFVSSCYIKASTRVVVEESLSKQYDISVEIFDRSWLLHGVFQCGCLDVALSTLGFSAEYSKKVENVGPHDKYRTERLAEIEKSIQRDVDGLDTDYVNELHEACILTRELECPRTEIEGKFKRAMRGCESHGTRQQLFNLVYDHAWTSLFWLKDVELAHKDYWELKKFVDEDCSVYRLERLMNIASMLISAEKVGITNNVDAGVIVKNINAIENLLNGDERKRSCLLYLRIRLAIQKLVQELQLRHNVSKILNDLRPMLMAASVNLDIGFESLAQVLTEISNCGHDSKELDDLLDELADKVGECRQQIEAARCRFLRGKYYFERKKWKDAVRQLSFCVYAFEKESSLDELIRSLGMMGLALWELKLPYSAEAFLVKAANFLLKDFWSSGRIPHLLVSTLELLCEIELMLGRLVMYFNWNELLCVMSQNAHCDQDEKFVHKRNMEDASWSCRFAASDLSKEYMAWLPDILERNGLFVSAEYLKGALGYEECVDPRMANFWGEENWGGNMLDQPVHDQFLCDLNVSTVGMAHLETSVNSFTFCITFDNDIRIQQVAEIVLASMESLMATYDMFDVIPVYDRIKLSIQVVDGETDLCPSDKSDEYRLLLNLTSFNEGDLWNVVAKFIGYVMVRNAAMREDICRWFEMKQCGERMMDRVSVLQHTKMAMNGVLGSNFKYRIEDWRKKSDRVYKARRNVAPTRKIEYENRAQRISTTYRVSDDMRIWEEARWRGCAFLSTLSSPPYLGLMFEHPDRGAKIIEEWGVLMAEGKPTIRITILRGINKNHPHWYRVNITPAGVIAGVKEGRYVNFAMGRQTMEVESSKNLDFFVREYKRFGACYLMSCGYKEDGKTPCNLSKGIRFNDIEILNAWELKYGDMACMALQRDDDPVIPVELRETAPVLKMLEQLKHGKLDMNKKVS